MVTKTNRLLPNLEREWAMFHIHNCSAAEEEGAAELTLEVGLKAEYILKHNFYNFCTYSRLQKSCNKQAEQWKT